MEAIVKELSKYWNDKDNKPCATRTSVRSTVYDELNIRYPHWVKMEREERQTLVKSLTNEVMSNLKK